MIGFIQFFNLAIDILTQWEITIFQHIVDHALQTHVSAIVGRVEAGDAVGL